MSNVDPRDLRGRDPFGRDPLGRDPLHDLNLSGTVEPEPARVCGYVSLVDPSTGAHHLVHSRRTGAVSGYPMSLDVRFESRAGTETRTITYSASRPFKQVNLPAGPAGGPGFEGFSYSISFEHHQAATGDPHQVGDSGIRYNPDLWRYAGLQIGVYFYDTLDAANSPEPQGEQKMHGNQQVTWLTLTPRGEPYTLPDPQ